jgi:hypothetical protein
MRTAVRGGADNQMRGEGMMGKWLRNKLRQWLFHEFLSGEKEGLTQYEFDKLFNARIEDIAEGRNLARKMDVVLKILRMAKENAMSEIKGETNSMFFIYPVRKRIPIKEVLRTLIDYLDLEMVVYKDKQGDLHPKIEQKMYRYVETDKQ